MLTKGPAKKVTIFINEDTPHRMTSLARRRDDFSAP